MRKAKKPVVIGGTIVSILAGYALGCNTPNNNTPTPAPVDNPPQIISYDIPASVFVDNEFYPEVEAEDDKGLLEVYIELQTASGVEKIPLQKTNGTWEGAYRFDDEGNFAYKIIAKDTANQETRLEGSIVSKAVEPVDNPPQLTNKTPGSIIAGEEFCYAAEAKDDRGLLEVYIRMLSDGKKIPLQRTNGLWEGAYTFDDEGTFAYKVIAEDTANQETSLEGIIVSTAKPLPDLVVKDGSIKTTFGEWNEDYTERECYLEFVVENNGSAVSGSCKTLVDLGSGLEYELTLNQLNPDESATLYQDFYLPVGEKRGTIKRCVNS